MSLFILGACAAVIVFCVVLFIAGGLMFSRSASRALAVVASIVVVVAWVTGSQRGYDVGSVLVICGALISAFLYTLISWAAGEN